MKHLTKVPGGQKIDLFHATTDYDQTAIEKLTAGAEADGVRLHPIVTPKDSRLTPERIRAAIPDWRSASLWYCGAAALGKILRKDFQADGISSKDFHQELFEMREIGFSRAARLTSN